MKPTITVQISEGLGNQLFMFSFAYCLSKEINYDLLIDNKSGYFKKKNLLRNHQIFMLDNFNFKPNYAPKKLRYDSYSRQILKKFLILLDNFTTKKKFIIEKKYRYLNNKISENLKIIDKKSIAKNLYLQGNYENCEYFKNYRSDLINIFKPKNPIDMSSDPVIKKLVEENSISIHIRRNRFSDQSKYSNNLDATKSNDFTNRIINYINRSVDYFSNKVDNPSYFIWSNDFNNFDDILKKLNVKKYNLVNTNNTILDFNLFKFSKHFIVGPSTYHWWGAWLNENKNKICVRPKDLNPSNNKKFWPSDWISI